MYEFKIFAKLQEFVSFISGPSTTLKSAQAWQMFGNNKGGRATSLNPFGVQVVRAVGPRRTASPAPPARLSEEP